MKTVRSINLSSTNILHNFTDELIDNKQVFSEIIVQINFKIIHYMSNANIFLGN